MHLNKQFPKHSYFRDAFSLPAFILVFCYSCLKTETPQSVVG